MKPILTDRQRLIVAADFIPDEKGRDGVRDKVLDLARRLPSGVCVKINSIARAAGYDLLDEIHALGAEVFLDLKLIDIDETLKIDGAFIREVSPKFLTAMCNANIAPLAALVKELPETNVLGVTVPTTWTEADCRLVYGCSIRDAMVRLCSITVEANLAGIICAPAEARECRSRIGKEKLIITPNVRFEGEEVVADDQNRDRSMAPDQAIQACADGIVMGRPIRNATDGTYNASLRAVELMATARGKLDA